ncbi:hypothetical protein EMIHUDRAFT_205588 [Emiliania huxleyi CCMP1516]|uniref:Uncharacterized protein n=2 Tax=Emiliania huxleyi TaxID=2903 RepID=A0A0D3JSM7_EMIH1|nr:hypothetical protein EMIHUDRAFT_205588 [Emiliania huxleyi CCMP1516]EOD26512.1 hypothetical protein EMIHUDRAFT_205588 [Emiliania huxleyi CCMP1516]|eukprot:XP_005778941.1 hypothetical protein EMIHUDRAFT_205588 [Emiliania huxleyi CCMP1516]
MPREELKQYLKEYSTESGQKLFAAANVDMLEHLPMSTVYEASKSSAKWEPAKKAETEAAASAKKSSGAAPWYKPARRALGAYSQRAKRVGRAFWRDSVPTDPLSG